MHIKPKLPVSQNLVHSEEFMHLEHNNYAVAERAVMKNFTYWKKGKSTNEQVRFIMNKHIRYCDSKLLFLWD